MRCIGQPSVRRCWTAAVLVLAVAGAGCGDVPTSGTGTIDAGATTTVEPSPRNQGILTPDALGPIDVWTWIGQQRHLEGTRRIVVPVRFLTDEPVTVTSIALRTPHFEPLPGEAMDSLLHPRRKVALQVDVGPARCGSLGDERSEVHLTASVGDAPPADLVLPVPTWLLDDLRDRECAREALLAAVGIRFGDFEDPSGTTVRTELVVERRGATDRIAIERIAGSVLLTLAPVVRGPPVGTLASGEDEVRIPVEVTATRCDAHGLAGSQKTYVFSTWVAVGDDPPVYVEVVPEPDLEAAMRATLDACIRAGG